MKQSVTTSFQALQRPAYFVMALGLFASFFLSVLPAHAAQVQSRSIKMSDNGISGSSITSGVGSGTNVTYRVSFTAASSFLLKGVVVDFCAGTGGTPFIGDATCAAPTSLNVGTTPVVDTTDYTDNTTSTGVNYDGLDNTTAHWSTGSLYSGQTFYMTNTNGGFNVVSGTKYTFAITGITNPSTLGTFYGRLLTFTTTADASGYTHGTTATYQDYGGFALSTAQVVQVTAKVQESLSFCVSGYSQAAYTAAYNTYLSANPGDTVGAAAAGVAGASATAPTSCADTTAPAIILGHGTNNTLDASEVDFNNVWSIASTNALNGLSIRMNNSNACGGLSTDNGTTCAIPAVSSGAATPHAIAAGTAAFGMLCNALSGGTGTMACDAGYNDTTNTGAETLPVITSTTAFYGMDTTSTGDNVKTTYGDQVAASTAPVNAVTNNYRFAATASNTTPAGIYKANLAMVATGTF